MERQLFYQGQVVGTTEMLKLQETPEYLFDQLVKEIIGTGVISGLAVTHNAGYGVTVSAGVVFTPNGRRTSLLTNASVNCAVDYLGAATVPIPQNGGIDQERYVSVFAKWQEELSDLTTLPDNSTAYYTAKDKVTLYVVAGAIAALGAGVRPAIPGDSILLTDIKLTSSNALANTFYTDRRQTVRTLYGLSVAAQAHTHVIGDVVGLSSQLAGLTDIINQKVGPSHSHAMSDVAGLSTALAQKAATAHTHTIANVTGLQAVIDALPTTYAGLSHSHSVAQVTGLQTALDGKASNGHGHTLASLGAAAATHSHVGTDVTFMDNALGYRLSVVAGVLTQTRVF